MDAAEYKHVVLGLIFLKYISDSFEEHHAKLLAGQGEYAAFVAEYEFLEEIPSIGKSVVITDVGELTLTNVFDNRFGLAAARHFRNEGQKFLNFMWRVSALLRILEDPSMKKYIRESISP